MCALLKIERSGYYAWVKRLPRKRAQSNSELDKKILTIFNQHKGRYGAPRLRDELQEDGERVSKNRVARRMKTLGIKAKGKKKFKATRDSAHDLPIAPNVLNTDNHGIKSPLI
jgi:transposase InsO family protein